MLALMHCLKRSLLYLTITVKLPVMAFEYEPPFARVVLQDFVLIRRREELPVACVGV